MFTESYERIFKIIGSISTSACRYLLSQRIRNFSTDPDPYINKQNNLR
jgi:hypothetical protein